MNKDDLLKLRERLEKDKFTKISRENLDEKYIVVGTKDYSCLDDCPIYFARDILKNKKDVSDVVDSLVNDYAQAIYAFSQSNIGNRLPLLTVGVDFIYKYDQEMIQCDNPEDLPYVSVKKGTKTLGDLVSLGSCRNTSLCNVEFLLNDTKYLDDNCFVSFNELLTELSSRGFYTNYGDFQTIESQSAGFLDYSIEPLPQKVKKI